MLFFALSLEDGVYGYVDVIDQDYVRFNFMDDGNKNIVIIHKDSVLILGKIVEEI